MPGSAWQPYDPPAGSHAVAPLAEGVLLQQDDGALSLQPWDGTAAAPLTGLPDGARLSRTASDPTGVLARDDTGGAWQRSASTTTAPCWRAWTRASTTQHRQLLRVPATGTRTGTPTLKVLSGQVWLDGLVLRAAS